MERVTPTGPAQGPAQAAGLPHGRGWAVVATDAGFILRLMATGADLRLSEADMAALRRGEVTGEALLERAGMALPAPPAQVPQPPIFGTTVSISDEGRRKAGQAGRPAAAPETEQDIAAGWQIPRPAWIAAGVILLLLALLMGMG
jgi:hypothetical protein